MGEATSGHGDKREALVRAAATVFTRQGFAATRVADIATEAEVGKGTVYEYFASKEELFLAVFEAFNAAIRARVDELLTGDEPALARLEALLRLGAELVVDHRDVHPLNLDFWATSRGGESEARFSAACNAEYSAYRELVAGLVREGQAAGELRSEVDSEALATVLIAAIDGLGAHYWLDRGLEPVAAMEGFVDALVAGLLPREDR